MLGMMRLYVSMPVRLFCMLTIAARSQHAEQRPVLQRKPLFTPRKVPGVLHFQVRAAAMFIDGSRQLLLGCRVRQPPALSLPCLALALLITAQQAS